MPLTEEKQYLEVEDVARLLGYHPETVRDLLRRRVIPGRKVGKEWRVDREQLAEYMRHEQERQQTEEK